MELENQDNEFLMSDSENKEDMMYADAQTSVQRVYSNYEVSEDSESEVENNEAIKKAATLGKKADCSFKIIRKAIKCSKIR